MTLGVANAPSPPSNAQRLATPARAWILALVLLFASAGLRELALFDHDAPPRPQLAHDAELVLPLVSGEVTPWRLIFQDPAPGERLWPYALVVANGQLDHRLSSVTTLAWQAAALAAFLWVLAQTLRPRAALLVGLVMTVVALAPTLEAVRPPFGSVGASGLVMLSSLTIALLARGPMTLGWWMGILAGSLTVVWSSAGLAAVVAVALGSAISRRRATFLASAVLVGLGGCLVVVRQRSGAWHEAAALASWPFSHPAAAILTWAPVFSYMARWSWRRGTEAGVLPLLATWALLQPLALAATGSIEFTSEYLLAVVGVNFAALVQLRQVVAVASGRYLLFAGAWLVLMADGIVHRATPRPNDGRAGAVLARRELAAVLPTSLRAPLAMTADAETRGFRQDGAPELLGRGGLPVVGTWTRESAAATGEFVSAPLRSSFPLVQLRVAGALQPPATALVLRTAGGREVTAFESGFLATGRWKRLNFPTPDEPFRVVARDTSSTQWLAFTAPVEVGGWTRIAGKVPAAWPVLFALGCVAAFVTRRALLPARAPGSPPVIDRVSLRRVAPWLGLFAYTLFFSHHVDPTAGPNDSGGYLNSAKLLVAGTTTAAPRIPAGMEIDRDPALYLPITFHVRGERLVPEYPVGFPLEVWALAQLLPFSRAVYVLILLQLVLGVIFTERLCRAFGLERNWAWFGAAIVGLSPVYLFQALQPQSDGPALVWVTAAMYWAWTSREQPARAVLAGLATALAVLLRPSNTLCVFPVLACLIGPSPGRRFMYLALAGLPGAVWLLWYQHSLYGSWHTTGYGNVHTSFGWQFLRPTLRSYAQWLPEMFTPIVVLALAAPFLRTVSLHARLVLTLWVALFVAFYSVYWCTWDNWYNMRFVLPAAPAMLVLGLLVLRAAVRWVCARSRHGAAACGHPFTGPLAAAVVLGFLVGRTAARDVTYWLHNNHEHEYAARWVIDHLPANAVVFAKHATGSLMHYTSLPFIRSDHEKACGSSALYEALERAGRPIYALTYHWETAGYTWQGGRGTGYPDLPGQWDRVAIMWDNDVMVWRRQPAAPKPAVTK